jgi:anti-sigma factor RsiW
MSKHEVRMSNVKEERQSLEQHCSEEILSAYLDGDLESEEAGLVAEHVAECPVCRQALTQVRTIRDAASTLEQMVPSDRTWHVIQERIRVARSRPRLAPRLLWVAVPALAAALLLVVIPGRARQNPAARPGVVAPASELTGEMAAEDAAREYQEYVRGIDRAIDECRTALDENPGNVRVRRAYFGASSNRQGAMDRLVSGGD